MGVQRDEGRDSASAMLGVSNELAAVEVNLDLIARRLCAECRDQSKDMIDASRQCLDLSRMTLDELSDRADPDALVPIPIKDRLGDSKRGMAALERVLGIKIDLTADVSQSCAVISNRELARQVWRKLVENAAKAGASHVRIHYQELSESVEIVFADNGRGMSTAEAETVGFSAMEDKIAGGQGAGLVRRLINRAGGTVFWDGRKNVGTWVTIRLRKHNEGSGPIKPRWGKSALPATVAEAAGDDPRLEESLKAAGAVHDVSNDLAAIGIHMDLIIQRSCPECRAQSRGLIESSKRSLGDAKAALDDMSFRTVPANYGLVRLRDRLGDLERGQSAMAEALGVEIELTYDVSPACMVLVNREGGRIALRKLIQNAALSNAKKVKIHYQELSESVELVVADDGDGMTSEEVEALGFAAQQERAALGQDIALVRQLINRVGGTVFWDSRKNVGTWVTIRVPKYIPDHEGPV